MAVAEVDFWSRAGEWRSFGDGSWRAPRSGVVDVFVLVLHSEIDLLRGRNQRKRSGFDRSTITD